MTFEIPSNNQLTLNSIEKPVPKWLAIIFGVICLVGFFDSVYLAAKHFLGTPVPCTIFTGCEKVLSSQYSVVFGIPVALLGAIYYLIFLGATIVYFDTKNSKIVEYLSYYSFLGLGASAWFIYVQLFLLKSICEFCILSALTSTTLFIFGLIYLLCFNRKSIE